MPPDPLEGGLGPRVRDLPHPRLVWSRQSGAPARPFPRPWQARHRLAAVSCGCLGSRQPQQQGGSSRLAHAESMCHWSRPPADTLAVCFSEQDW